MQDWDEALAVSTKPSAMCYVYASKGRSVIATLVKAPLKGPQNWSSIIITTRWVCSGWNNGKSLPAVSARSHTLRHNLEKQIQDWLVSPKHMAIQINKYV